jgi:hypothetical protein
MDPGAARDEPETRGIAISSRWTTVFLKERWPAAGGSILAGLLRTREMPEYRACHVSEDGSVLRSVLLVCPDDEVAKVYARQLVDGHAIELWQGERRVGKFIAREGEAPR